MKYVPPQDAAAPPFDPLLDIKLATLIDATAVIPESSTG